MRAFDWIRTLCARRAAAGARRRRVSKWDPDSLVPRLAVKRLEARRVLNADAAPVEVLIVDAGDAANDGQADTIQIEQDTGSVRVLVNGQETANLAAGDLSAIHVQGSADNDLLVADLLAGVELTFDGAGGADSVDLTSSAAFNEVQYQVDGDGSGALTAQGPGDAATFRFLNVETINDRIDSSGRSIAFGDGGWDLALRESDDGGLQLADEGGREITVNFLSPLASLEVDTTGGDSIDHDQLTVGSLSAGLTGDLGLLGSPGDALNFVGDIDLDGGGLAASSGTIRIDGRVATSDAVVQLRATESITLGADGSLLNHAGSVEIDAPEISLSGSVVAAGGDVFVDSGDDGVTLVDGRIDVSVLDDGGVGGTISLLGGSVALLDGGQIDASGAAAGGAVFLGGGYQGNDPGLRNAERTYVGEAASIVADATRAGSGGTVIVWSDEVTQFYGAIRAQGGASAGDGGFVEVSGKETLIYAGVTDLRAVNGAVGTLLLDPRNIRITTTGTDVIAGNNGFNDSPSMDVDFDVADVEMALTMADVVLQANNDITLETSLTVAMGANDLTLQAGRHVIFASTPDTTTPSNSTGAVAVTLNGGDLNVTYNDGGGVAGQRAAGTAEFLMAAGSSIVTGGGAVAIDAGAAGAVGGATVAAITTGGGDAKITAPGVSITGAIATGAGDLGLVSSAAVTQTAAISGSGLLLMGAGPFTLTEATNDFANLAADVTGDTQYVDATALTVTTVDVAGMSETGVTSGGADVKLTSAGLTISEATATGAGDLGLVSSAAVTQSAAISGTGLLLTGAGPFTLTEATNDFANLAADVTGDTQYVDATALTVTTVDVAGMSETGIASGGADVKLTSAGLTISEAIATGAGDLGLVSSAAVTQTAAISGSGLLLMGAGPFTLTEVTNDFANLAADVTGDTQYVDATALTVTTVDVAGMSETGVASGGADVKLTSAGLTISEAIATGAGDLGLLSSAAVTQSAAISGTGLLLMGAGPFTLTEATNDFANLAADVTGDTQYVDATALTVTTVDVAGMSETGVASGGADVKLTSAGLTISEAIATGAGDLGLVSSAAVTQTAAISGTGLLLIGAGPFALTEATNDFANLAADVTGDTQYVDATALTVTTVDVAGMSETGIASGGADVKLTSAGLTISEAIATGAGDLGLVSSTAVTQTAAISGTGLLLMGAGPFALTEATNDFANLAADVTGDTQYVDATALTVTTVDVAGMSETGIASGGADVKLTSAGLTISEAIATGAGDLGLVSSTAVTQTAAISGTGLLLMGAGPFALTEATNDFANLAADVTGDTQYVDATALTVTTVDVAGMSETGIASGGADVKLTSAGLTISEAIATGAGDLGLVSSAAVTQTAAISGTALLLMGAGPFTLTEATNDFANLAADTTNDLSYVDADDLAVATVGVLGMSVDGIVTTADDVSIHLVAAGSTLTVPDGLGVDGIRTSGGDVTLTADNMVLETAGANLAINAGAGKVTLAAETSGRAVDLGTETAGELSLTDAELNEIDADFLAINAPGAGGITVTSAIDPLLVPSLILMADGDVDQTATITVANLGLMVAGTTTLDLANEADVLAADSTGATLYTDATGLTIGQIAAPGMTLTGVNTSGADAKIDSAGLAIDEAITTGGGDLGLVSSAGVTQSAAISGAGLLLMGAGPFELEDTSNEFVTIAGSTSGVLSYVDDTGLTVAAVTVLDGLAAEMTADGINTNGADAKVDSDGLTIDEAIATGGGDLGLVSSSGVTQSALISGEGLFVMGAGPFELEDPSNEFVTIAGSTSGVLSYVGATDLSVDTVIVLDGLASAMRGDGIETTGFDVTLRVVTAAALLTVPDDLTDAALVGVDGIRTSGGDVTLTADNMALEAAGANLAINAGAGVVTLQAETPGRAVDLGTETAGELSLTDAELDEIVAGFLKVNAPGAGGVTVTSAISLGALSVPNLILMTGGNVDQSAGATITVTNLGLMVSGNTTLTQANQAASLAANNGGTTTYTDADDLTISEILAPGMSIEGVSTTADDVSIRLLGAGATLTVRDDLGVDGIRTAGGDVTLTADNLTLQTAGADLAINTGAGTATLQPEAVNRAVDLGTEMPGELSLTDAELDEIDADFLKINAPGAGGISATAAISLASGLVPNLVLMTGGAVDQAAGATITVMNLGLMVTGTTALGEANGVTTLAADVSGDLTFTNAGALAVGQVAAPGMILTGIDSAGADVKLTSAGLMVGQVIDAGAGNLALVSSAPVTQTAAIDATGLLLSGAGSFTLGNASNSVVNLAANATGTILYVDTDNLAVPAAGLSVLGEMETGVTSTMGNVSLTAGNDLSLAANVTATMGSVTLAAGRAAVDAITINAGVSVESSHGSITGAAISSSGGRLTGLDSSIENAASPNLTTGETAVIDVVVSEPGGTETPTFIVDIDWREEGGDVSNAGAFAVGGDPPVLPPPADGPRVVSVITSGANPAFTAEHTYIASPDGGDFEFLYVAVQISSIALDPMTMQDTIELTVGGVDLLAFDQGPGSLVDPDGVPVDLDGDGAADRQIGIMTIVRLQVLELPLATEPPKPDPLPAAEPVTIVLATPAAPTFVSNVLQNPTPASNTPGVNTPAEVRYYELRIVSFDENGFLVETPRERINLSDPKLEAIAPFNPSRLPELFRRLPGDRYRIYLVEDGAERLMIDFVIEQVGDEGSPVELPQRAQASPDGEADENLEAPVPAANDQSDAGLPEATKATPAAAGLAEASFVSSGGLMFGAAMMSRKARERRAAKADRRMARFARRGRTRSA